MYKGDERQRTLEISVDDVVIIPEWKSSGTTLDYETIPMPRGGVKGEVVTLRALLKEEGDWISITEVRRGVVEGGASGIPV